MSNIGGISKDNREKLAALIRGTKGVITIPEVSRILNVARIKASIILSNFANSGWIRRIKRGVYVALPIEASNVPTAIEDAWTIADRLFAPCYIGGWSAIEYWGLTEQVFSTTIIITAKRIRDLSPQIKNLKFLVKVTYPKNLFGLKSVWRNNLKVQVSDPSRTMLDILDDPKLAGGIRIVADVLAKYLASSDKNLPLLINYATRLGNRTVFKRLGFLLEHLGVNASEHIEDCKKQLSAGNSKLDPDLAADCLVKRWRLWIPQNWRKQS